MVMRISDLKAVYNMKSQSQTHYVYILQCEGGKRYCGMTAHVINRFVAHLVGKGAKFTTGFKPINLLHLEQLPSYIEAVRRERQIKKTMRRGFIILYSIYPKYQGVFEIISAMLLTHPAPYVKRKLNLTDREER
jgi:putative endonuclease